MGRCLPLSIPPFSIITGVCLPACCFRGYFVAALEFPSHSMNFASKRVNSVRSSNCKGALVGGGCCCLENSSVCLLAASRRAIGAIVVGLAALHEEPRRRGEKIKRNGFLPPQGVLSPQSSTESVRLLCKKQRKAPLTG